MRGKRMNSIQPVWTKLRLDDINWQILTVLILNGRITMTELANRLHISRPAVQRRIKRMEDLGIIACYSVEIDWNRIEPNEEGKDGV